MNPEIQLIASLVVLDGEGAALLVRYDADDPRWWLPGADLESYEHPDEAAARVLATLPGLEAGPPQLSHVDSFRGRRGWHVVFHYRAAGRGAVSGELPAEWHPVANLPPTAHRPWEQEAVDRVCASA